ncbi:MAG: nitroreductase family protein [Bacilli bacterium]|jgi:nitroreductase
MMERKYNYEIMDLIKTRWSPRAISEEKLSREEIMPLIEAARFAPSCFNEQPWRFVIADKEETLQKMRNVLMPGNQIWANKAPVLLLIVAKKNFTYNNEENFWHMFDAGTAWGFLTLEAQKRGLVTHAMGGFDMDKTRSSFNISEDYEIITIVAIGKYGNKEALDPKLRSKEHPDIRMETEALILK